MVVKTEKHVIKAFLQNCENFSENGVVRAEESLLYASRGRLFYEDCMIAEISEDGYVSKTDSYGTHEELYKLNISSLSNNVIGSSSDDIESVKRWNCMLVYQIEGLEKWYRVDSLFNECLSEYTAIK